MTQEEALSQIIQIAGLKEIDRIKRIRIILQQLEETGKQSGICEIGTTIQGIIYNKVNRKSA